jgi:hypothetical protein
VTNKVLRQSREVNSDGIVQVTAKLSIDNLKSFHRNGAWPYFPGNKPATEPTVVCAIACRDDDAICTGAINFLLSIRNPDGGWSSGEGLGESDWNTGLALFGISRLSTELKSRNKFSPELEEKSSRLYKESMAKLAALRADTLSDLSRTVLTALSGPDFDYPRGWPWEQNTFHWVEPTAYSLMAIKFGQYANEKRFATAIEQAHKYLYEKTCKNGGWNWGQTSTLGFDFPAVPRDTALALLAMQDQKENPQVKTALQILRDATGGGAAYPEPLAILALEAFGDDVSNPAQALAAGYKTPEFGGENLVSLAYAAMASNIGKNGNGLKMTVAEKAGT